MSCNITASVQRRFSIGFSVATRNFWCWSASGSRVTHVLSLEFFNCLTSLSPISVVVCGVSSSGKWVSCKSYNPVSNLIAARASGDAMSNQECNRGTKSVVGTGIFCNQIHCFLALLDLNDVYQGQRTISTARNILTSFFFRFLIGSGVSSSGDAAVPAARFLTLIPILFERKGEDLKWTNVRVL